MPNLSEDADYWRKRAQEVRTVAATLHDPEAKHIMESIGLLYDTMAKRAEQRTWPKPHPDE